MCRGIVGGSCGRLDVLNGCGRVHFGMLSTGYLFIRGHSPGGLILGVLGGLLRLSDSLEDTLLALFFI